MFIGFEERTICFFVGAASKTGNKPTNRGRIMQLGSHSAFISYILRVQLLFAIVTIYGYRQTGKACK